MLNFKNSPYSLEELEKHQAKITAIHTSMEARTSLGAEYLGWLKAASTFEEKELKRLIQLASKIREEADLLVVAGIGGSYLGADALIQALKPTFGQDKPQILFCGNNLSAAYMEELLAYLEGKCFYVNVISKSGRTVETALAFRFLKKELTKRYGQEAGRYIIATTDAKSGALRRQVEEEGYKSFVVPQDIGGRYSVMSPVGLFPMAVAGLDVKGFLAGMTQAEKDFSSPKLEENAAYRYALTRRLLYKKGKIMEILVTYEPALEKFAEWYKQLFGESEGKEEGGIFPVAVANTTDLHSMGQIIQDGPKIFFETVVDLSKPSSLVLPEVKAEDDLDYLQGQKISGMTKKALLATLIAHEEAGVSNLLIEMESYSEESLGYLMYFMMRACAMSAYLGGVNPFDQPGVEAYKNNMLALLGNPNYKKYKADIEKKLREKNLV
ncbi:MAG TPA: glucose-6-phosphate isomerase [Clostridia bacterium]|nr:glucose-6-phosphate isomerase [Clostridia bacterium]